MEAFKLPMREVRKRFTKSELAMVAWRSGEMAHNMTSKTRESAQSRPSGQQIESTGVPPVYSDAEVRALEARMGPVAYKIANKEGEVDLRQLTGNEALQFMGAMGIRIGGRTVAVDDDVTAAHRANRGR